MKTKTIEERFWKKVNKNDPSGCWLWTACVQGNNGYGFFRLSKELGNCCAHRYSFELIYGKIPEGMIICHKCDIPTCVNPDHLFLGTHRDNALDREKKNKNKIHGRQKLNPQEASDIKNSNLSQSELSKIYKVSRKTIANIQYGQTWKNISSNLKTFCPCKICGKNSFKSLFRDQNYIYRRIMEDICLPCQKALSLFNNDPILIEKALIFTKESLIQSNS